MQYMDENIVPDDLTSNVDYVTGSEEMRNDIRQMLSSLTDEERDPDEQIDLLEEFISNSDPECILEKIAHSMVLGGYISGLPVPDDKVGLPPRLAEYVVGKVVAHDEYGDQKPGYLEISKRAYGVSQAYTTGFLPDIDPHEMSDAELEELELQQSLRTREITSGKFMFDLQIENAAQRAYKPHDEYLKELNGFTIDQAIDYLNHTLAVINNALTEAFEKSNFVPEELVDHEDSMDKMMKEYEEEGTIKKFTEREEVKENAEKLEGAFAELGNYRKCVWIPEEILIESLPERYSTKCFQNFLDRMSYELYSESYDFRHIDDFNPLYKNPIITNGDEYIIPQAAASRRSLLETFFYDLISHPTYGSPSGEGGGEFGDKWGEYIEKWTYDSLVSAFGEDHVYLNPYYKTEDGTWEEAADVIVIYQEYLLVFECKSKKLVLESRGGNVESAKEDLESGIGKANEQATSIIRELADQDTLKLKVDEDYFEINNNDIKRSVPCVIIGEQYDDIATNHYYNVLDLERDPFVVSVYDLEIICELLQGFIFISYITQRIKVTRNGDYKAMDEIDLLGLFLDNEKKLPDLPEKTYIQLLDYSSEIASRLNYKFGP
ncbi:hypothetical protein [Halopiger thermotolerans]